MVLREGYLNSIPDCGSCFSRDMARKFQYGRSLPAHRSKAPRTHSGLDIDYGHGGVEVDNVDREPHAQRVDAMAGNNPEAGTITEVIRSKTEQSTQPRPGCVGNRESGCQIGIARAIECLGFSGEYCHLLPTPAIFRRSR